MRKMAICVSELTSWLIIYITVTPVLRMPVSTGRFRGPHKNRLIGVSLDMFFQILRTFEGLSTEIAFMRLQRYVDSNV